MRGQYYERHIGAELRAHPITQREIGDVQRGHQQPGTLVDGVLLDSDDQHVQLLGRNLYRPNRPALSGYDDGLPGTIDAARFRVPLPQPESGP